MYFNKFSGDRKVATSDCRTNPNWAAWSTPNQTDSKLEWFEGSLWFNYKTL